MAENEGTKREKVGIDISDDLDVRLDGGRRPGGKREVALYRPGCGLLPKSPRSELEDNMSSSTSNLNAAPPSISKKTYDPPPEGFQNGPQNGSQNAPHGHSRGSNGGGSGGGGGRRSGHSAKGRSGRSDRGELRGNRESGEARGNRDSGEPRGNRDGGESRGNRDGRGKETRDARTSREIGDSRGGREIGDARANRESKDIPVSRLSDQLSQVHMKDASPQGNGNEPLRSESISSSKVAHNSDIMKKTRKPEQQLYIPKPVAQSIASKETVSKVNSHNREERWSDDDSASYCAEEDSKTGPSQGNREARKKKPRKKKKGRRGDGGEGPKSEEISPLDSKQERPRFQDTRLEASNRPGQDTRQDLSNKAEPPRSTGSRPVVVPDPQARGGGRVSGSSDTRSRPPPPLMSKSMIDNRRNNHGDGGMSQSWHADAPQDPEKVQAKPPSGRRGSGKDMPISKAKSYSSSDVPPRFRKLKMQENGMKDPPVSPSLGSSSGPPGNKYIGTTSEEVWDGTTVTFQGSASTSTSAYSMPYQSLPTMGMPINTFPHAPQSLPMYPSYESSPHWSSTIPTGRPRGRGRLRPEEAEMVRAAGSAKYNQEQEWAPGKPPPSTSAPCLSGPSSLDTAATSGSRNQALPSPGPLRRRPSGNSIQDDRSPARTGGRHTPTPPTSPDGYKSTSPAPHRRSDSPDVVSAPMVPEITDWSEEVERSERLEAASCKALPVTCQDWNEEMERMEQQETVLHTDRFAVPHQDWSEEVERSERLEAGGGSESHTRSPSPVSRTDDSSMWKKPVPTTQWRRNKRRKKKEKRGGIDGGSGERGRDGSHSRRGGSRDRGPDRPPSRSATRGGSREHSLERADRESWRRDRSNDRGPWRGTGPWKRDPSREPSPELPSWRSAGARDHPGDGKGPGRRNGAREHSPHHDVGPDRDKGRLRREPSHERSRDRGRQRRNSGRDRDRDHSPRDRGRHRRNSGRDVSRDHSREVPAPTRRERMGLEWRRHHAEGIDDDWRRPIPNRQSPPPQKAPAPGILVLPQELPAPSHIGQSSSPNNSSQRQLFNPSNPNKPIIVVNPSVRASSNANSTNGACEDRPPSQQVVPVPAQQHKFEAAMGFAPPQLQPTASMVANQFGSTRPTWYDPYSDSFRMSTEPHVIHDIEKADLELQWVMQSGSLLSNWSRVEYIRKFLQEALVTLLLNDIKFLHKENADQHLWKILFYNIIEVLRKFIADGGPNRDQHRHLLLCVIDDGINYLESLVSKLQDKYKIRLDECTSNTGRPPKLGPNTLLAIVVAQKLYLFLGDLARYREQANDSANFGKARQWYIKAHQLNPKSGRPYNQLAIIAVYARRKLDAVYYYMRGLMASNSVVHTARESLLSLFDENRKKYEQTEKRRREDREAQQRERARMLEKEGAGRNTTSLRREVWHHPQGGHRVSRTTTNKLEAASDTDSELAKLSSVDLNKRFVMSYLHIHGKLFTKVGMETFQGAALQMLREFYALLQHSPIPSNANRFLQLLALNMFAIDNTQLKELEPGYRSAAQEAALLVSLEMFSVLLERCVALLREQVARGSRPDQLVDTDVVLLLPAIKVWCDWLTCHLSDWNPPPCSADYHVGPPGDAWTRLATLVNLLDTLDVERGKLSEKMADGYIQVRLPEDTTLAGFLPLMSNVQEPLYAPRDLDTELVHVCARIKRLLFFGHTFLCGIDPPVLKLHKDETGRSEYISVVALASTRLGHGGNAQDSLSDEDQELDLDMDLDEDPQAEAVPELTPAADATDAEIRALLVRKEELERHHRRQERHRKRVQDIIMQSAVEVEIEVRPHFIVPDTNCFVDHLQQIKSLTASQVFQLMVPIVVVGELEGLSRGGVKPVLHAEQVARSAKDALAFLRQRPPSLRCVTTRGTVLNSAVFTMEEDGQQDMLNDDKILTTCLNLSRTSSKDEAKPGEPRRLVRDVVLLTEDRNLRVKALARDVPVRELPDFMRWANMCA